MIQGLSGFDGLSFAISTITLQFRWGGRGGTNSPGKLPDPVRVPDPVQLYQIW